MDYSEFVAVVAAPKEPELKDFERVSVFAHNADKEQLWMALGNAGIHPIYRALLVQAIQRQMLEEIELERAQKRKREEELRLALSKDGPVKDAHAIEGQAPRRRMR